MPYQATNGCLAQATDDNLTSALSNRFFHHPADSRKRERQAGRIVSHANQLLSSDASSASSGSVARIASICDLKGAMSR